MNEEYNLGNIVIYNSDDGNTKIDVKIENETVWLTQQQMAELFHTSRTNVIDHINNIYEEELDKISTCRNFRQVRTEGNRKVSREMPYYNLDMIISLGYRIKSKIATNFRKWATERLKELHYAAHGHTASEVIYERADSNKPFMGLTTFKGELPTLSDVVIAKNYLDEH